MSRLFDRVDDYIGVGTMGNFGTNLDNNFFFFSTWVKSSDTTHIINLYGTFNTGTTTALQIQLNTQDSSTVSAGRIHIFRRDESGVSRQAFVTTDTGITNGNWHHIAGSIGPSAAFVWVDSISQSLNTTIGNSPTNMANFGFEMVLGARNNRGTIDAFFSGRMAYPFMDSTVNSYTDSQVRELMFNPGLLTPSGGFWLFLGTNPEGDYSGKKNNGTVNNGTAVSLDNPPINAIMKKKRSSLHYATMFPVSAGGAVIDTGKSNDLFSYVFTG